MVTRRNGQRCVYQRHRGRGIAVALRRGRVAPGGSGAWPLGSEAVDDVHGRWAPRQTHVPRSMANGVCTKGKTGAITGQRLAVQERSSCILGSSSELESGKIRTASVTFWAGIM